jgi:large subunit ribosomal protein L32
MPQPKSKVSKSRRGMRRSHDFITRSADSNCSNCGAVTRPHRVCSECGYYKGKEVLRLN